MILLMELWSRKVVESRQEMAKEIETETETEMPQKMR